MAMGDTTGSAPRGPQDEDKRTRAEREAKDTAREAKRAAGETAEDLKAQARHKGEELSEAARERARETFGKQQSFAANQIEGVANALRQAAEQLNDENQGTTARYVDEAANRVERFAEAVRGRSLDDIMAQTEGFARRQPELFLGGALLAGVALGRFLRSSSHRGQGAYSGRSHGASRMGGGYAGGYGSSAERYGESSRGPFARSRPAGTGGGGQAYGSSGYAGSRGMVYNAEDGDDYAGQYQPSGGMDEMTRRMRTHSSRADEYAHYPAADGLAGRNAPDPLGSTAHTGVEGGGGMGFEAGGSAGHSTGGAGVGGTGSDRRPAAQGISNQPATGAATPSQSAIGARTGDKDADVDRKDSP